jgi:CheY-like chemotaxis protein
VVAELLTTLGYEAVAVASSAEVLDLAASGGFVLALLDLTLPGEPGGAACARDLRHRGFTGTLVAMSGYSHDSVLARPGAYGFDGALVKPFSREALSAALERTTRNRVDWSHDFPRP